MKNFNIYQKSLAGFLMLTIAFLPATLCQWTVVTMPHSHLQFNMAVAGDLVYLGPGSTGATFASFVDVYNATSGEWEAVFQVSQPRANAAGVAANGKIYFAGGLAQNWLDPVMLSVVDIYDTESGEWTTDEMSEGRSELKAVHVGDKLLFAGGLTDIDFDFNTQSIIATSDVVDIYDLNTGEWSVAHLSVARVGIAAAASGNYAVFAGGQTAMNEITDAVDIYNAETGDWTTLQLSEPKGWCDAQALGNKVYIAGGATANLEVTDKVEILDLETMTWSYAQLSEARAGSRSAVVGDSIFFAGGGIYNLVNYVWLSSNLFKTIDIYDGTEDVWSVDYLQYGRINHAAAGTGNKFMVAGGVGGPNRMEVFTVAPPLSTAHQEQEPVYIFPNPFSEEIDIQLGNAPHAETTLGFFDLTGRLIRYEKMNGTNHSKFQLDDLPTGMYTIKIMTGNGIAIRKVCKL